MLWLIPAIVSAILEFFQNLLTPSTRNEDSEWMNRKTKPGNRGRSSRALAATMKPISTADAILHLFGNSLHHLIDALLAAEWKGSHRQATIEQELSESDADHFRRVVAKVAKHKEELLPLLRDGLQSVEFGGRVANTLGGLIARDFEGGGERLCGNGLVFNVGYVGEPGRRKWEVLNETEWLPHLMSESKIRSEYTTTDRHVGRSE